MSENQSLDLTKINNAYHLGRSLLNGGEVFKAIEIFQNIIMRKPDCWEAYFHIGLAYYRIKDLKNSIKYFEKCKKYNEKFYDCYNNLGIIYRKIQDYPRSISNFEKAIAVSPNEFHANFNLACTYSEMGMRAEAIRGYRRSIEIDPKSAGAAFNLANQLVASGAVEEAVALYTKAVALDPDLPGAYGQLIHAKMLICDWSDLDELRAAIIDRIERGEAACTPFVALTLTDSPRLQAMAGAAWAAKNCPKTPLSDPAFSMEPSSRIRLGYFSMDFRNHPVSTLMAGVIEAHDRSKFEVFAFSYGRQPPDAMRARMEGAFDHFIDVKDQSDADIVKLARKLRIDIAVDLAGYTTNARPAIMALRPAPVQVGFLGFVGSQGVPYIDHLIADKTVIPENLQECYPEKISYIPCFQPNDGSRVVADISLKRSDFGLSDSDFVFCCFNNTYKISPDVFRTWLRVLVSCPNGKLLLLASSPQAEANLRREARSAGVGDDRLVFTGRVSPAEYLARFRIADLFLDTLPYNAGTTASDALWAGLPVLTCTGDAYNSRMAASLLTAINVPELITTDLIAYADRAIELSRDPEKLASLRERICNARTDKRLFDAAVFTETLEDAYLKIWRDRMEAQEHPAEQVTQFS